MGQLVKPWECILGRRWKKRHVMRPHSLWKQERTKRPEAEVSLFIIIAWLKDQHGVFFSKALVDWIWWVSSKKGDICLFYVIFTGPFWFGQGSRRLLHMWPDLIHYCWDLSLLPWRSGNREASALYLSKEVTNCWLFTAWPEKQKIIFLWFATVGETSVTCLV